MTSVRYGSRFWFVAIFTCIMSIYLRHSNKAILLWQDGLVGQSHCLLDRLVDSAVAKVDVFDVKLEISVGDHSVDGEGHWTHLQRSRLVSMTN